MSEISSHRRVDARARPRALRRPFRLGLVLMTLSGAGAAGASAAAIAATGGMAVGNTAPGNVATGHAATRNSPAAEQRWFASGGPLKIDLDAAPLQVPVASPAHLPMASAMYALPAAYQAAQPGLDPNASADFRPRGHSVFDRDSQPGTAGDIPLLHETNVWQRLADYRSHGRIQVLTLWESGASSFSLQAGKKGTPSLQWTSRLMNHGSATRGVLDQWVSPTLIHASHAAHEASHGFNNEPASKPGRLTEMGLGANQ